MLPSCLPLQVKKKYYEQKRAQQQQGAAILPNCAVPSKQQQQQGLQQEEASGDELVPAAMAAAATGSSNVPGSPAVSTQGLAAALPAKQPATSLTPKTSLLASGKASPLPVGLSINAS